MRKGCKLKTSEQKVSHFFVLNKNTDNQALKIVCIKKTDQLKMYFMEQFYSIRNAHFIQFQLISNFTLSKETQVWIQKVLFPH